MRTLFILFFCFITNETNAQAYSNYGTNNEIKFNIGRFLSNAALEGSYEFYFTEDTSIGGTVYFNSDNTHRNGNFGIGPNLRAYFGYAPQSGFFAEAFGLYYTGANETDLETNNLGRRNIDYDTIAIGLGLGRKWSTFNQKLTFEAVAGLGRNINPQEFQNTFIFRSGLTIGIRF